MLEEQLVSFATAKLAKEKGFNLKFKNFYTEDNTLYESENRFNLNWNDKSVSSYELTWDQNDPEIHICYTAPTQSLLQKWLREKYNIHITVTPFELNNKNRYYAILYYDYPEDSGDDKNFDTYEEALENGLQDALKLIKL